jgi:hypothetical protein
LDTLPARYYRNGKRIDGTYPCFSCPYGDNKTCSMCVFARWNVEGVLAGFSPDQAYRKAHGQDAAQSPLLQKIAKQPTPLERGFPANEVLPRVPLNPLFPVPTYNSITASLSKLRQIRRRVG